jgi:hypothetical protein
MNRVVVCLILAAAVMASAPAMAVTRTAQLVGFEKTEMVMGQAVLYDDGSLAIDGFESSYDVPLEVYLSRGYDYLRGSFAGVLPAGFAGSATLSVDVIDVVDVDMVMITSPVWSAPLGVGLLREPGDVPLSPGELESLAMPAAEGFTPAVIEGDFASAILEFSRSCSESLELADPDARPGEGAALCECIAREAVKLGVTSEQLLDEAIRLRRNPMYQSDDNRFKEASSTCLLSQIESPPASKPAAAAPSQAAPPKVETSLSFKWEVWQAPSGRPSVAVPVTTAGSVKVEFPSDIVCTIGEATMEKAGGMIQALKAVVCQGAVLEVSGTQFAGGRAGCSSSPDGSSGSGGKTEYEVYPAGSEESVGSLSIECMKE